MAATKAKANGAGNREQRRAAFKRPSKVVVLKFEDPEYDGLVVRTRAVSLGQLLEIAEVADGVSTDPTSMDAENIEGTKRLLALFANVIVDWNLEAPVDDAKPDGASVPVPATFEGLLSQDFGFSLMLFQTWMGAMGDVAAPLGATSPAGKPSAVPSIPMDELSPSQPS